MSAPALRFKDDDGIEFPEWRDIKVSELNLYISDGNYGEQYPTSAQMVSSGVPFIRANNIKEQKLIWNDMKFITPEHHKILTSGHLLPNDILITTRGEIGSVALVQDEFGGANINAQICLLRVKETNELTPKFLLQELITNYCQKQFKELQTGSALKQLPKSSLGRVSIKLPCLIEQTKIANFLTAVDEKISQLTQKHELLNQYKKGVMQKIFSQELRFKDDDGSEFPDWEEKEIGDVFLDFKGKGLSKDKIGRTGKSKCILYGHLFTKYAEVIDEIDNWTDLEEGTLSKEGDILMPSSTTTSGIDLAKASYLSESDVLLGGDIIVLRSKAKSNGAFFAYFLTHARTKEIASVTQGLTIVHLYFSQLKNISISIPSYEEQTKIANFLTAIDENITASQSQLELVKQYKQGLLQQMFV